MQKIEPLTIGWREWLALPELGIVALKAKVDTGARTSALHAYQLETFQRQQQHWVRFYVHLSKHPPYPHVCCEAQIIDQRVVSDSGGHREQRYVICTPVRLAGHEWPIEITLTNRDTMRFPMLLGRTAMPEGLFINPTASYLLARPVKKS
ncbi:ribosomal protein S6 modification protein [Thioflexithrix psekupsensis]|uniref:Ribosomal protein S6 modification protein n=1 Tax=Thioflexithrix psekupsensis TaxID=1570016 RepID=A0A251X9Q0_9GAMM|nr:ribosomal protein S6 modification protein [Thioflexithrix psekupsensis]